MIAGALEFATSSGGFAARDGALNIQLNGGTGSLTWNGSSFVQTGQALIFGSSTANDLVDFQNSINLGSSGTNIRTLTVLDNPDSATDRARISGALTNTGAGQGILKNGAGLLELSNTNSYTGPTNISGGTLAVSGSLSATTTVSVTTDGTILLAGTGLYTNKINPAANVSLGDTTTGGTLALANDGANSSTTTQSAQTFTNLTLSATSTLDFGSNTTGDGNILRFAGTTTLSTFTSLLIKNWSGTEYSLGATSDSGTDLTQDRLLFTSDPGFGALGSEISSSTSIGTMATSSAAAWPSALAAPAVALKSCRSPSHQALRSSVASRCSA